MMAAGSRLMVYRFSSNRRAWSAGCARWLFREGQLPIAEIGRIENGDALGY
jgi:hypothetical protein